MSGVNGRAPSPNIWHSSIDFTVATNKHVSSVLPSGRSVSTVCGYLPGVVCLLVPMLLHIRAGLLISHMQDRSVATVFRTLRVLVSAAQRTPPSLEKVLLPESHSAVVKELERRTRSGAGGQEVQKQHGWTAQLMREYRALGLRYGAHTADQRSTQSPWFLTLTPRERAALAFSQATSPGKIARNLSQSMNRVAVSHEEAEAGGGIRHVCPAVLPTQMLWLDPPAIGAPRLMLGREALVVQGFPIGLRPDLTTEFTEGFMQDLAGNMMTLPVLLAMVVSTIAALPWKGTGGKLPPPPASQSEVAAALESFLALRGAEEPPATSTHMHAGATSGSSSSGNDKKRRV